MAQNSGPPPIVYILILLGLGGAGYWWFSKNSQPETPINLNVNTPNQNPSPELTLAPVPNGNKPNNPGVNNLIMPTNIPMGMTIRIDGSTSMVTVNKNLEKGFKNKFPKTNILLSANGSNIGIKKVLDGSADVVGLSRPLTVAEQNQGLNAIPIALDSIALVVGINNPFQGSLTSTDVEGIFQGSITNWSSLGGEDRPIRVINRPVFSGTHQAFKELILKGTNFGNTPNITTWPKDETTTLFRELKTDGITYATYPQVLGNKGTVRAISIDNMTPDMPNYPYQRKLLYVYKNPPNLAVRSFLGYAISPQGKKAMLGN